MATEASVPDYLSLLPTQTTGFDARKAIADDIQGCYRGTEYDSYADRMRHCAEYLSFIQKAIQDGNILYLLSAIHFCKVRWCPVCQWGRSRRWRARVSQIMPVILEKHPSARFLFLTLTVRNCPLNELRETLGSMHKAWAKLVKRKDFPAIGWIRATEVTRAADDKAHPHYHCLLMVNPSYFSGRYYLNHERWVELWRGCLKVSYDPYVDVRVVKPKSSAEEGQNQPLTLGAMLEVLKYSVKPSDLLVDDSRRATSNQDWIVELTRQMYKTRSIAVGGVLKEYLKELEQDSIDSEDVIETDGNEDVNNKARYKWNPPSKRYKKYA